jgi:plasmid segregation protein ParM
MKTIPLGVDDGYFGTKIFDGINGTIIKSRARRGKSTTAVLFDTGATPPAEYVTDKNTYSVGDTIESSSIAFDDYPKSSLNRVIIQHALQLAGMAGKKISMCSGLPMRHFYTPNGKENTVLINAKIENCLQSVVPVKSASAIIESAHVLPEGFALMFDLMFTEDYSDAGKDGTPKVIVDESIWTKDQGFVDIGGNTVDIGVISNGSVDVSSTSSLKFGVHKAYDIIKAEVCTRLGLDDININKIDMIVADPLCIDGHDFTDVITNSYRVVVEEIFAEISRCIGKNGQLLDSLNFLGGGTELFKSHFPKDIKKKRIIPNPVFANASGFYKYAKYVAN